MKLFRLVLALPATLIALVLVAVPASAQSSDRAAGATANAAAEPASRAKDPRDGDVDHERSKQLLAAIDHLLREAADIRQDARKLPSEKEFTIVTPPWVETREDRQAKVAELLDSALEIVTDAPIVEKQQRLADLRQNIKQIEDQIAALREKQLDAPKSGLLPGVVTDTVDSIDQQILDDRKRIDANNAEIAAIKKEISAALAKSGVEIADEQLDVLLGSIVGGDVVKLVAAFEAARSIDQRLGALMEQNGDNLTSARRYFALHASLFALLVHAQETLLDKIDNQYLPRLEAIVGDIRQARKDTYELLRNSSRTDQRNMLLGNLRSQSFSEDVAKTYKGYLLAQRDQIAVARQQAMKDLRIADNTFQTVEASFQLRSLIKDASGSFEAIRKLEAPGFDKIFRDDNLRREFENLTQKLAPTS